MIVKNKNGERNSKSDTSSSLPIHIDNHPVYSINNLITPISESDEIDLWNGPELMKQTSLPPVDKIPATLFYAEQKGGNIWVHIYALSDHHSQTNVKKLIFEETDWKVGHVPWPEDWKVRVRSQDKFCFKITGQEWEAVLHFLFGLVDILWFDMYAYKTVFPYPVYEKLTPRSGETRQRHAYLTGFLTLGLSQLVLK
eukprot:UN25663